MSSRRADNEAKVRQQIADRAVRVDSYPYEIQFSGEHRCNLRCIQCGATIERNQGAVPLMDQRLPQRSLERFLKLRPQIPYWQWLSLTGSGETLINPQLPEILAVLSETEHECSVAFNTNGTLWTREKAEMVVRAGVSEIRFSMDGATRETFEAIRVNAKFDRVLDSIRTLRAVRDELSATTPKITFSCNFMRRNIEELPLLVELAHELGAVEVIANNTILYDPAMADDALSRHGELVRRMLLEAGARAARHGVRLVNHLQDDVELPEVTQQGCGGSSDDAKSAAESLLPPMQALPDDLPEIVKACQRPWTGLYVENNGFVKVCCFDVQPIGNLDMQSFDEIWNGPLARELRRSFLEDRPPEGCRNCFIFAARRLQEEVFVRPSGAVRSHIDEPGVDPNVSGTSLVHGWALDQDGVARVELLVDGEPLADAAYGHQRPDVDAAFPGYPDGANCGFSFELDAARLAAGEHLLSVRVHSQSGHAHDGPVRPIVVQR